MRLQVRLLPLAELDLRRLEDFLAGKSARAAVRASRAIGDAVLSLREQPERHPIISEAGTRELPVRFGRDGYVVQYRVYPDVVLVARIFHVRERR